MIELNETLVFLSVKQYLISEGWMLIGGQPPSGTDNLPVIEIRDPTFKGKGSKGSYKPDLIAIQGSNLMIIELKPNFSKLDRVKVNQVLNSRPRLESLWEGILQRNIQIHGRKDQDSFRRECQIVGGLGYGGRRVEHPELWRFFVNNSGVEVRPGSFATSLS
jgi:hypothetical protein